MKSREGDRKSKNKSSNRKPAKLTIDIPSNNVISVFMYEHFSHYTVGKKCSSDFIIYSPEYTSLRNYEKEGQIEPLGVNGEGLLKLLTVIYEKEPEALAKLNEFLKILGWFQQLRIVTEESGRQEALEIEDVYVSEGTYYTDLRSDNEGFLFILFYFYLVLFYSDLTPKVFGIDNIDASLNPKLCENLIRRLAVLAKEHDKQGSLTTHNPSVLDGLNLDDEDQRLFIVSRGERGETRVRRFLKRLHGERRQKVRLSEAFISGAIGGLPRSF